MFALTTAFLLGATAYLIGSIPFGLLIARAHGVNIQEAGSRNIGATNVFRCVGKRWGVLTFACDVSKGFVSSFLLVHLAARAGLVNMDHFQSYQLFCASLAIVGHNWPVFLGFRGGKGVATTVGGLLGIIPFAVGLGLLIWTVVFVLSRYVSLASIVSAVSVCTYIWLTRPEGELLLPGVMLLLAFLIVWRHKANIIRLTNGTENRFHFGSKQDS